MHFRGRAAHFQTSSCEMRYTPREVFRACGPRCVANLPMLRGLAYLSLSFLLFSFFSFSSGFAARKKKQIPFIAGSLRTGACAVKGGGVSRSLERIGNP